MVSDIQFAAMVEKGSHRQFSSCQLTARRPLQKTEVKIRLPGRAVQSTELKTLWFMCCKVNNSSSANEMPNIQSVKQAFYELLVTLIANTLHYYVWAPGYRFRGPEFDPRCYQIFWEVVDLEWGSLSLVRITEEILEWKSSVFGSREPRLTAVGIRCADHATPSIRKS
jgi:hypothetical protein